MLEYNTKNYNGDPALLHTSKIAKIVKVIVVGALWQYVGAYLDNGCSADTDLVAIEHLFEMPPGISSGHVLDDVTCPGLLIRKGLYTLTLLSEMIKLLGNIEKQQI